MGLPLRFFSYLYRGHLRTSGKRCPPRRWLSGLGKDMGGAPRWGCIWAERDRRGRTWFAPDCQKIAFLPYCVCRGDHWSPADLPQQRIFRDSFLARQTGAGEQCSPLQEFFDRQWRTWFAHRSLAAVVSPPGRCKHRPLHRRGGFHIRPGRLRLPQASVGSPRHDLREMPTHFPRGRVLSARLRAGRARPLRRWC